LQRVKRKLEKCLDLKWEFILTNKKNDSKLYNWYIKEHKDFECSHSSVGRASPW
jgi:hypothetical protein